MHISKGATRLQHSCPLPETGRGQLTENDAILTRLFAAHADALDGRSTRGAAGLVKDVAGRIQAFTANTVYYFIFGISRLELFLAHNCFRTATFLVTMNCERRAIARFYKGFWGLAYASGGQVFSRLRVGRSRVFRTPKKRIHCTPIIRLRQKDFALP